MYSSSMSIGGRPVRIQTSIRVLVAFDELLFGQQKAVCLQSVCSLFAVRLAAYGQANTLRSELSAANSI